MYTDQDAYRTYPNLRHFYNKLWLSETLGYHCGPSGIAPKRSGWYIVRPIMNLSGMGVGASKTWISAGDLSKVPPGYFWCDYFKGTHRSITYKRSTENIFEQTSCFVGYKNDENLSMFTMWKKDHDILFELPQWIQEELAEVDYCNIELINTEIIEIHLRKSPDPDYSIIIPVWVEDTNFVDMYSDLGYSYISSYDNADGFLKNPRYGFMVK